MSENPESRQKKEYTTPVVTRVKLEVMEAVLTGCKTAGHTGPLGNSCPGASIHSSCSQSGS